MNATNEGSPILAVRDLKKSYGKRVALAGVSFSLLAGEFVLLLGPNGAGKTTLFNLITGLFVPDQGEALINGFDIVKKPIKALKHLGIVFQQSTLDLDLSVYQNLKFHADLHGIPSAIAKQRIKEDAEHLDLANRLHEKTRKLNGGHRRRVELIRALLHRPPLILLDEPTVGLDIASRQFILDHIHALCKEKQVTVLWASHLIDEAQKADRIIIQHQGSLAFVGTEAEVIKKTQSATLKEAFNHLTPKIESIPN